MLILKANDTVEKYANHLLLHETKRAKHFNAVFAEASIWRGVIVLAKFPTQRALELNDLFLHMLVMRLRRP
jgi:hypothetical protein